MKLTPLLVLVLGFGATAESIADTAPPFPIRDQNPFIQVFGLPPTESADLTSVGETDTVFVLDITNNSMLDTEGAESISLDGESYRGAFIVRHGLRSGLELGAELPYIAHRPGVMDNFIEGWHDTFGLSNSERNKTPSNSLDFNYSVNGTQLAGFNEGNSGMGDLRLFAGYSLLDNADEGKALSLRASLKLPTGDASQLHGSEATDLAVYLSAKDDRLHPKWRLLGYAQGGLLFLGNGEVLAQQQKNVVGFASVGTTWKAHKYVDIKVQLDGHTSFYDSSLNQLGAESIQLTVGGSLYFGDTLALDIGIGENLFTDTTPDFLINLVFRQSPLPKQGTK